MIRFNQPRAKITDIGEKQVGNRRKAGELVEFDVQRGGNGGCIAFSTYFEEKSNDEKIQLLEDWMFILKNKYESLPLYKEASPSRGTAPSSGLQPPTAVVTRNKKVAVVAAPRRSLGAGS
tara:strand:- start:239 stop:598 length:360 start_codon:yes stop_codon:yes gene_type:complete